MSDWNKLAKFMRLLAVFLAGFSAVDFASDLVRLDLTLATLKSFGMLVVAVVLYLSFEKPELFKTKS